MLGFLLGGEMLGEVEGCLLGEVEGELGEVDGCAVAGHVGKWPSINLLFVNVY